LQARAAVDDAERAIRATETHMREREWEAARFDEKLKDLNARLYSGKTRPAKELATMQKEAEYLLQGKRKEEDAVLEDMARLEEQQTELAGLKQRLAAEEAAWREEQTRLGEQRQAIQADLARLAEAREELVRAAVPADLPVYESLRRQRAGRAVARVEKSLCGGCRVFMALQQVQRARNNPGLTFCSSCGRIVYVGS
jgi:predicted  nucleic acid-binding Zn-ribbon protein